MTNTPPQWQKCVVLFYLEGFKILIFAESYGHVNVKFIKFSCIYGNKDHPSIHASVYLKYNYNIDAYELIVNFLFRNFLR